MDTNELIEMLDAKLAEFEQELHAARTGEEVTAVLCKAILMGFRLGLTLRSVDGNGE